MYSRAGSLIKLCSQFLSSQRRNLGIPNFRVYLISNPYSVLSESHVGSLVKEEEDTVEANNSLEVFRKWGCSDDDIHKLFIRRPSLRNANHNQLQSKLALLSRLGLESSDLVKIIKIRPRFLSCRINHCFDERLDYFMTLFGSAKLFCQAITRNPSLLLYDFDKSVKPVISVYESLGVRDMDLIRMLLSRPTLIPRSSFSDEKIEFIHKSGVSRTSKMYKYVVTIIGVSRLETIRLKVANLQKFGFSEEEVLGLFGRSPLVLTLSTDKVQRNMTFVVGTMKLSANVVLHNPYLLFNSLETCLRPRMIVAAKIQEMGLSPTINKANVFRAIRMSEKRYFAFFVNCHPKEVAKELMGCYSDAKSIKRLAETSRIQLHFGFPF